MNVDKLYFPSSKREGVRRTDEVAVLPLETTVLLFAKVLKDSLEFKPMEITFALNFLTEEDA
jgi:hypothetical protein